MKEKLNITDMANVKIDKEYKTFLLIGSKEGLEKIIRGYKNRPDLFVTFSDIKLRTNEEYMLSLTTTIWTEEVVRYLLEELLIAS